VKRALVFLLAVCACGRADPTVPTTAWSDGPPMPRPAFEAGVTIFGQRVIVAGGFDSPTDVTAEVDAFDIGDDKWVRLPDAPVRWSHINLAAIADTVYLLGGLEGAPGAYIAHGQSWRLDPGNDQWTPIQMISDADARGAAGVISSPGHIFLLGGATASGSVASCLQYDIATNAWTHLPDLPAAVAHPAVMQTTDGRLIVAGGLTGGLDPASPATSDVWSLQYADAGTGATWQPRAPLSDPDPRGGCAYGVVLGSLVCAGGGGGGTAADTATSSYDPNLDRWTVNTEMPEGRTGTTGAATTARLFIPGGSASAALEPLDSLLIFTPLNLAP
jgi:N-acetylneuraminic acid mutarotase